MNGRSCSSTNYSPLPGSRELGAEEHHEQDDKEGEGDQQEDVE